MRDAWFSQWFNQDYLKLYSHRDEGEARAIARLIEAHIPALGNGTTLDLACGSGRHLPSLRSQQKTIGLDLSPWLLDVARKKDPRPPLIRADMRALPFCHSAFTLVVNLFTSFGYFDEDAENARVLQEVARVTRDKGWLVLDFLHASRTRRTVVPFDRQRIGAQWVDQERQLSPSGRFVVKIIHVEGEPRVFMERVRLFDPSDLVSMLQASGFVVKHTFGDYQGRPLTPQSPRVVLFAQKG